jgi:hypothetical protein
MFSSIPPLLTPPQPRNTLYVVRTPATSAHFQTFRATQQTSSDVVATGGWYEMERASIDQLAASNFAKLRPNLPANLNVVECGGWYALQQHAADPKGALIAMIQSGATEYNLQAITALLQAMGKGFDSDTVDGEWTLLMAQQGRKSAKIQKLVGTAEKMGSSTADFNVGALEFYGRSKVLKYGLVSSTVRYRPTADNFETGSNKKSIILRRIACDIIGASWKFGRLPRLPLPLRIKGGYLDFVYLDGDIRVTKGNRGGLFVHGRPDFVASII